jgi:fido (protein-threonine AMPylation protein)
MIKKIPSQTPAQLRFRQLGRLEFREMQTSTLSCLAAFLRTHGIRVHIDDLLDVAPIPPSGLSARLFDFVVRRIGIKATEIDPSRLAGHAFINPVLLRRKSGYSMLVLDMRPSTVTVALPGNAPPVCTLKKKSDVLDDLVSAHSLQLLAAGPAFSRRFRQSRLWLLPCENLQPAQYISSEVTHLRNILESRRPRELAPEPLAEFSVAALLNSHRSICGNFPEYYGQYRTINLQRHRIFIDACHIAPLIELLLLRIVEFKPRSRHEIIRFATRVFVDFLSIHPFFNANRRMAMELTKTFLAQWNLHLDWKGITSAECYYWTRCAANGHFRSLEDGFRRNLVSAGS